MVDVSIFGREVDLNGLTYPAGALLPSNHGITDAKLRSLRSNGILKDTTIEDPNTLPAPFTKGTSTPAHILAEAQALVDTRAADLAEAKGYLATLKNEDIEAVAEAELAEHDDNDKRGPDTDAPETFESETDETDTPEVAADGDGGGNDETSHSGLQRLPGWGQPL